MAATKKPASKKSASKKSAAKTSAAKTSAAKTSAAEATASTTRSPLLESSSVEDVRENFAHAVEQFAERAEETLETIVKIGRDATYTSLGVPFVVQDRVTNRNFELIEYGVFVDEAKAKGHDFVVDMQARVEPITDRIGARLEPITDRIEAQLPQQVRDAVETRRDRMRELLEV